MNKKAGISINLPSRGASGEGLDLNKLVASGSGSAASPTRNSTLHILIKNSILAVINALVIGFPEGEGGGGECMSPWGVCNHSYVLSGAIIDYDYAIF